MEFLLYFNNKYIRGFIFDYVINNDTILIKYNNYDNLVTNSVKLKNDNIIYLKNKEKYCNALYYLNIDYLVKNNYIYFLDKNNSLYNFKLYIKTNDIYCKTKKCKYENFINIDIYYKNIIYNNVINNNIMLTFCYFSAKTLFNKNYDNQNNFIICISLSIYSDKVNKEIILFNNNINKVNKYLKNIHYIDYINEEIMIKSFINIINNNDINVFVTNNIKTWNIINIKLKLYNNLDINNIDKTEYTLYLCNYTIKKILENKDFNNFIEKYLIFNQIYIYYKNLSKSDVIYKCFLKTLFLKYMFINNNLYYLLIKLNNYDLKKNIKKLNEFINIKDINKFNNIKKLKY